MVVIESGNGSHGHPVGVLTDRGLVARVLAQTDQNLEQVRVDHIMTRPAVTVGETDELADALDVMRAAGVRRLPVAQPFGTSFAAPHVSGLAALLVAQRGHNRPGQIRARILESADDLGDRGRDPVYGFGRINLARALGVTPHPEHDNNDR